MSSRQWHNRYVTGEELLSAIYFRRKDNRKALPFYIYQRRVMLPEDQEAVYNTMKHYGSVKWNEFGELKSIWFE